MTFGLKTKSRRAVDQLLSRLDTMRMAFGEAHALIVCKEDGIGEALVQIVISKLRSATARRALIVNASSKDILIAISHQQTEMSLTGV